MKALLLRATRFVALPFAVIFLAIASDTFAQAPTNAPPGSNAPPAATSAPPPAAPAQRSAADLEKLVAPIALYPDPLIAIVLPASVYPLEIVQAARFVKDTNNISKLDEQPWDDNVKEVARIPDLVAKLDADIGWTSDLGQAFLNQQKEVMDMIQSLRLKAQKAGTLQTSEHQNVVVTNTVVEQVVNQQTIVVTNQVVEIVPTQPQVIYVPTYDPVAVYYPPYGYVYNPVAPLVTFGVGMAVGAAIANNCDWHGGGVYVGHHGAVAWGGGGYHNDVDVNRKVNVENNGDININNQNVQNRQNAQNRNGQNAGQNAGQNGGQKWQPDQSRLQKSGSAAATDYQSREARGWGSGSANNANLPATGRNPSDAGAQQRPATPANGSAANRPANQPANRPATQPGASGSTQPGTRPSTQPGAGASGTRPSTQPSTQPSTRPSTQPSTRPSTPSASRPSTQPSGGSSSAFSGANSGNRAQAQSYSNRGATSRASGGGGGGGARGGGGGGGGRR